MFAGDRAGKIPEAIDDRRIALKRHVSPQPVVKNRRDQRSLFLDGGLFLDQRSQSDNFVGVQGDSLSELLKNRADNLPKLIDHRQDDISIGGEGSEVVRIGKQVTFDAFIFEP